MGFFSSFNKIALPIVGGLAGAVAGGPIGGLLGMSGGSLASGALYPPVDPSIAANQAAAANTAENIALEKEFAQNGISWRIADAARNGISPLAALGASEPSFSPVGEQVFTSNPSPTDQFIASGIDSMGQNIGRAVSVTKSADERAASALSLIRMGKENDLLALQVQQAQLNLAKQNDSPGIPLAYQRVMNRDGTTSVVPTYNTHSGFLGGTSWALENQWIPNVEGVGSNIKADWIPSSHPSAYSTGR